MPPFVNPYNFVCSDLQPPTEPPRTHERTYLDLYSGRLHCTLTTVSRIAMKSLSFYEGSCIYGSSLKGMIRSVAEAIAQGCFVLGGLHCSQAEHLCICCRIFGWLKKGDVHSGRVSISDAKPPRGTGWREEAYIEQHALSEPKPRRHPLFYPQGGRKFYYHHNPDQPEPHVRVTGIQEEKVTIARANQQFSFKVDFADLNGPELGLLLYALQLEDDWYHKLGYGKPLGFGTVKIAVDNIEQRPSDYYENWDNCFLSLESISFIQARIEEFFQHQFHCSHRDANTLSHWRDLSHLLKRHDGYNIHYPSQQWFTNHPNETLPTPTEIEAGPGNWLPE